MRFLVTVEADWNAANKLDAGPGGPGPLFGYIAERFKPEAFVVEAGRRVGWWIIDFPSAEAITEFTHITIARAGAYPTLRPVLAASEAAQVIPRAAEQAKRAP
jgi:hypothetical protein